MARVLPPAARLGGPVPPGGSERDRPSRIALSAPFSSSAWLRARPPSIAFGIVGLSLAMHAVLLGAAAPLGRAPLAGGLIAAAGIGWMLWAAWAFRAAGTTILPTGEPSVLVEEGPFRFGRNPMYLGIAVALLGAALALGVPVLALGAAVFAWVVQRVHIPYEEARLRQRFGGWYADYQAEVRRWV